MTKSFIPGTVVHGEGHSLASHAAIHCVINNIPFITSYEPKVGQVIEAVVAGNQPLNREEFLRGVHASLKKVFSLDVMLHISASILHNWTFIRTSPEASWLLGVAASYITQVLLALCFGEFRHAKKKIASFSNLVSTGMGRTDVYKNVVNPSNFLSSLRKAPTVSRGFVDKKNFPKKEFGGIKWARATNMAIKIWNSIITIQNRGISNVNINRLISNINKATHLVHNGGWLFNKVSVPEKLDKISNQPNLALFELSDYVFEVYEEYLKVDEKLKSVKSLKQIKVRTNK
jgi:hypothetical protein